jgi:hypothetical protein
VLGDVLLGLASGLRLNPRTPPLEWRSAQWLPVYLIGMGLISWQGGFCRTGPASSAGCGAENHLPLWWDILVIAVFSLAIYFWARAVRLPDEKTQQYIAAQPVTLAH